MTKKIIINSCMKDTPETKMFKTRIRGIDGDKHWVPAGFAEILERERDKARRERDEALLISTASESELVDTRKFLRQTQELCHEYLDAKITAERERDEARAVLSNLSHYLSCGLGDDSTTAQEYAARIREGINFLLTPVLEDNRKLRHVLREAWLAMDEVEGIDRIDDWQNKNAHVLDI